MAWDAPVPQRAPAIRALEEALADAERRNAEDPGDRVAEIAYLRVIAKSLVTLVLIQSEVHRSVLMTQGEFRGQ